MESGALDGVSAIFGAHVDRRYPVGTVVADAGPLAASADTFDAHTRRLLHEEIRRVADAVATAHRLKAQVTLELGPPPIVNPVEAAA